MTRDEAKEAIAKAIERTTHVETETSEYPGISRASLKLQLAFEEVPRFLEAVSVLIADRRL